MHQIQETGSNFAIKILA